MVAEQRIYISANGQYRTLPLIAYEAICVLDRYITKSMTVFEWGCGGSSLFFAQRARSLISVEHNRDWIDTVSEGFHKRGIYENVEFKYHAAEAGALEGYTSRAKQFEGMNFSSYVRCIDEYEDSIFGVVMIDGRARSASLRHAGRKLVPRGLLVLDNSDRREYKDGMELYEDWPHWIYESQLPYHNENIRVQTTIWQKPVGAD